MPENESQFQGNVYLTVRQLAGLPQYPWLTESSVRHLIHNAQPRVNSKGEQIGGNGMASAILRVGRRVIIDLRAFEAWLRNQQGE